MFSLLQIEAISEDCPNVLALARELHVDVQVPSLYSQMSTNCCNVVFQGIWQVTKCDSNNRITFIAWNNANFVGNGPLYGFIDPQYFPPLLTHFALGTNQVTGSIPALPSGLNHLNLASNMLTGTLPNPMPTSMLELYVDCNLMSGDVPSMPPTLQTISLGSSACPATRLNKFTGTLWLNQPYILNIDRNLISDISVFTPSQLASNNCDISKNPLLSNPNIVPLSKCVQTGLFKNTVTTTKLQTTTTSAFKITTVISTIKPTTVFATKLQTTFMTVIPTTKPTTVFTTTLQTTFMAVIPKFKPTTLYTADPIYTVFETITAAPEPELLFVSFISSMPLVSPSTSIYVAPNTQSASAITTHTTSINLGVVSQITNEFVFYYIFCVVSKSILLIIFITMVVKSRPFKSGMYRTFTRKKLEETEMKIDNYLQTS